MIKNIISDLWCQVINKALLNHSNYSSEKTLVFHFAWLLKNTLNDEIAIIDFEKCKEMHGNSYEMDHTYNFYIALSHLQLNEFAKAEEIFNTDILEQIEQKGEAHHLDLFYYGISLYEQKKWEQAIEEFDKAISQYENFSDAKVYKAFCLGRIGQEKRANDLLLEAKADAKNGYTINEDNMIHEVYPYKVKW